MEAGMLKWHGLHFCPATTALGHFRSYEFLLTTSYSSCQTMEATALHWTLHRGILIFVPCIIVTADTYLLLIHRHTQLLRPVPLLTDYKNYQTVQPTAVHWTLLHGIMIFVPCIIIAGDRQVFIHRRTQLLLFCFSSCSSFSGLFLFGCFFLPVFLLTWFFTFRNETIWNYLMSYHVKVILTVTNWSLTL